MGKATKYIIQDQILEEAKTQGITQTKFAEMVGCTRRAIIYWKRHEKVMTLEMADKACRALGIRVTLGE